MLNKLCGIVKHFLVAQDRPYCNGSHSICYIITLNKYTVCITRRGIERHADLCQVQVKKIPLNWICIPHVDIHMIVNINFILL